MLAVLSLLLSVWSVSAEGPFKSGDPTSFDFIVVGGGSAGLAVAARLAETNSSVAVIEAGVHHINDPLVDTPALFGHAQGNPDYDWNFLSIPQTHLNGQTVALARGKMLGGSSGLNYMDHQRASSREYDAWEQLGNDGWNFQSLLPYFKKGETVQPPDVKVATFPGSNGSTFQQQFHGTSGPIQASYNVFYSNLTNPYVQTLNGLGVSTNSDPYGGSATGIFNAEETIDRKKGVRSYSANSYYKVESVPLNLRVFTSSQATRVMFKNGTTPLLANAVQMVSANQTVTLQAKKEVILSTGVYQTPQLLELSGIGNKSILDQFGITSLLDLPQVGENLQEQASASLDWELKPGAFFTFDEVRNNATFAAEQQALYNQTHTGFFAAALSALAFTPFHQIANSSGVKSAQQSVDALLSSQSISPLYRKQLALQRDWLAKNDVGFAEIILAPEGGFTNLQPEAGKDYMTILTAVVHPFSRGSVHITSADPLAAPAIDPEFLQNAVDVQTIVAAEQFARKIAASKPLAPNVVSAHQPPAANSSDAALTAYTKATLSPLHHGIGTAAMAPRADGGVVSNKLVVYGTSNLRVVDASVMPLHIAAHPTATIYAIAEKAADIIKKDNSL